MSNLPRNSQQGAKKRERSTSQESQRSMAEQTRRDRELKKPKLKGKDGSTPENSTQKELQVHQPVPVSNQDDLPNQGVTLSDAELLRRMMEDDEDEEIQVPDERKLRKAKHVIREQIDVASEAHREMRKAIADFDKSFSRLQRAHVHLTTRDTLTSRIFCVAGCTQRIVNSTYLMKAELEILKLGIEDDGEMAHLLNAILETEKVAEMIGNNDTSMTRELRTATSDNRAKGVKGFDAIKRFNTNMQRLVEDFLIPWRALLGFAEVVGAKRSPEFERAISKAEDDED
ncbi:hypothetical protein FKW77_009979 [Venturia effusa]|uniref:Uncharacterized protein n=1 Tax=Venturia effusa TaxID=50376 RepID=A0A517L884_9PEZI|nr:hypothetical protein FKW77_009979 [Venturia effusa]